MLRCKSTRKTLVLSLVLLKDLKFKISSWEVYYGMNTIEFQSYGRKIVDIQGVCHELNHALHDFLGIEGVPTHIGVSVSELEQGLFRFLPKCIEEESIIRLPPMLICYLFGNDYRSDIVESVEMPLQQFYRTAQITLL